MKQYHEITFELLPQALRVNLYRLFYFNIPRPELDELGEYEIKRNSVNFKYISKKKANNKFNNLISRYILNLKTRLQNKDAIYIHRNSGIPLIGLPFIGLVDRNTSCIELKPITGCNIGCTFCSVNEGIGSNKEIDFVIEKDYLVEELQRLISNKLLDNPGEKFEICINAHGEPTLYSPLSELIQDISKFENVSTISLITNATLLTKSKIDELIKAGLNKFNLSINTLNPDMARELTKFPINIDKIKQITKYIASRANVTIAPVLLKNINESDIEEIIVFAKNIKTVFEIKVATQNFLMYKAGRNPVEQLSWDNFTAILRKWENKHNLKLIYDLDADFGIHKLKSLPKPFTKGDCIKATIVCNGRYKEDRIAVSHDRSIVLPKCSLPINSKIKALITSDKHNIFYGKVIY